MLIQIRRSFGAGWGNEEGEGGTPESLEFVNEDVRLRTVGCRGEFEPVEANGGRIAS